MTYACQSFTRFRFLFLQELLLNKLLKGIVSALRDGEEDL